MLTERLVRDWTTELRVIHDGWRVTRETLHQAEGHLTKLTAARGQENAELETQLEGLRTAVASLASDNARLAAERAALKKRVTRSMTKVVILGAGFDCRGLRLPGIDRARVFEVDHPATSVVKRTRLRRTLGALPANIRFVEVDLAHQELRSALEAAGFDGEGRSLFLWEGVTNYLSASAVDSVLRSISRMTAGGSTLVVTYVHRGFLDGSVSFAKTGRLMAMLRRVGERWTFGLDPAELPAYLAERGFRLVEDLDASAYRARVIGPSATRLRGYEFYHTAIARVRDLTSSSASDT